MSLRRKPVKFEKTFPEFRADLERLFSMQSSISSSDMHHLIYEMCNATPRPLTEKLFIGIADFFVEHCSQIRENILLHDDVPAAYRVAWERYSLAASLGSKVWHYLDKLMVDAMQIGGGNNPERHGQRARTVGDSPWKKQRVQALALLIWKEKVVEAIYENHNNRLMYQVLEMIRRDREGDVGVNGDVIKSVIDSLVSLNAFTDQPLLLYIKEFERPHLLETRRYYQRESAHAESTLSVCDFMHRAQLRLVQEQARSRRWLHKTSVQRVIQEFETQYIGEHKARIAGEFSRMVEEDRETDCTNAYSLLSRVPGGLDPLLSTFQDLIYRIGMEAVRSLGPIQNLHKDPRPYISSLLKLHAKYTFFVSRYFGGDTKFGQAVDKAFRDIINAGENEREGAELLARYCDLLLRKNAAKIVSGSTAGEEILDEADIEERLARMITLFKYVDDKDIFQKFYARALAKRLIFSTSSSEDAEANMIGRLKETCGVEYTGKLHRMFTDVALSSDLMARFREYLEKPVMRRMAGFEIMILTAGSWPIEQRQTEFQVPSELEYSVTRFTNFYNSHFTGRKISWLWHLSRADVKLNYLDRTYELAVSVYQLGVLLLFNSFTSTTVKEIKEATRMPEGEVKRVLKSLIDAKVLSSKGELVDSSVVMLNMSFSSKRPKIKISASLQPDTPAESENARRQVDEDRRLYLQAAVVRVMKSRRVLGHAQLVQEVIDQSKSRFMPSVPMIKRCIENLLEKGYLDREGREKYTYVA